MIQRLICFIIFILFLIILQECGSVPNTTPSEPLMNTPMAKSTTPSFSRIFTPVVTSSTTPGSTQTIPFSTIPSNTPTTLPTLEPQEAEVAIHELLKKDSPCQSPCIWGVMPDQTTLEEANIFFDHLDMPLELTYKENGRQYYETGRDLVDGLGVTILYIVQDGYVRSMKMGLRISHDQFTPDGWPAYAPRTLLARYGSPSSVDLFVNLLGGIGPEPEFTEYNMTMYFDNLNLIIEYYHNLGLTKPGNLVRACPGVDNSSGVSIWLGKEPHNPPLRSVPLEKATSLTLDQFNKLLMQDPNKACFNIREDAFSPKP